MQKLILNILAYWKSIKKVFKRIMRRQKFYLKIDENAKTRENFEEPK